MGLDISHYKVLNNLPNPSTALNEGCLYADDFELFQNTSKPLQSNIKEIVYCDIKDSLHLVNNLDDCNELIKDNKFNKQFGYPMKHFKQVNSESEANKAISEFEIKNKLIGLHHYRKKGKWTTIQFYDIQFKRGLYFECVGYQRKGMNDEFWKHFSNNDDFYYYTELEDFQYAYNCIDKYWESDTSETIIKRKDEFRRTFLDNFQYGISFLGISY